MLLKIFQGIAGVICILFIINSCGQSEKYEVMDTIEGGKSFVVLRVFTMETNVREVIKINDRLLEKYRKEYPSVSIQYFNDKELALTYFDRLNDADEAGSDELFTHYVFDMDYNGETGRKVLNRNVSNTWVELKVYQ